MYCVYSDQIRLTKEQVEAFQLAWDGMKRIVNAIAEAIRSIVQSPSFQELLSRIKTITFRQDRIQKKHPKHSFVRSPAMAVKDQFLDRRPRMHVIRNNC